MSKTAKERVAEMSIDEVITGLRKIGFRAEVKGDGYLLRTKGFELGTFNPVTEVEMRRHLASSIRDNEKLQAAFANGENCVVLGGMEFDDDE